MAEALVNAKINFFKELLHKDDSCKGMAYTDGDKQFSMDDIFNEIDNETELGKRWRQYTVDFLDGVVVKWIRAKQKKGEKYSPPIAPFRAFPLVYLADAIEKRTLPEEVYICVLNSWIKPEFLGRFEKSYNQQSGY